jgi:hypothetical protein
MGSGDCFAGDFFGEKCVVPVVKAHCYLAAGRVRRFGAAVIVGNRLVQRTHLAAGAQGGKRSEKQREPEQAPGIQSRSIHYWIRKKAAV